MDEQDDRITRTSGINTWRAGCAETCTSGSEGGPEKPTDRQGGRALRSDPYTEIPTGEGPLILAATEDLFSRRVLGFAMGESPNAELAHQSLLMAIARRGGSVRGVIFHSDQGSTYTADDFGAACRHLGVDQSMGRVGSSLDNACAESFFSTLKTEFTKRRTFATREEARREIAAWIDDWYNTIRRHSTIGMMSPVAYEKAARAANTTDRAA